MVKQAEVMLGLENDTKIDCGRPTDVEKEFITGLAAIYAIFILPGVSGCRVKLQHLHFDL